MRTYILSSLLKMLKIRQVSMVDYFFTIFSEVRLQSFQVFQFQIDFLKYPIPKLNCRIV